MKRTTCRLVLGLLTAAPAGIAVAQAVTRPMPTILVVVAHPDDENVFAPMLARATRQGTRVVIAYATDGELGVRTGGTPIHSYAAGGELADVRAKEAACACVKLGAQAPVRFRLANEGLDGRASLAQLEKAVRVTMDDVRPDVVLTWGPDGGYGHIDHRIVSAVVTQVLQSRPAVDSQPVALYYAAFSADLAGSATRAQLAVLPLTGTMASLISTRVPYTAADFAVAADAQRCHVTQFLPAETEALLGLFAHLDAGAVTLRRAFGTDAALIRIYPDARGR